MDMNLVVLQGTVGERPRVSRNSARTYARLWVVLRSTWKDAKREHVTWVQVLGAGDIAEKIGTLEPGDGVFVRGEMRVREVVGEPGEAPRPEHYVFAFDVQAPLRILNTPASGEPTGKSAGTFERGRRPNVPPAGPPPAQAARAPAHSIARRPDPAPRVPPASAVPPQQPVAAAGSADDPFADLERSL